MAPLCLYPLLQELFRHDRLVAAQGQEDREHLAPTAPIAFSLWTPHLHLQHGMRLGHLRRLIPAAVHRQHHGVQHGAAHVLSAHQRNAGLERVAGREILHKNEKNDKKRLKMAGFPRSGRETASKTPPQHPFPPSHHGHASPESPWPVRPGAPWRCSPAKGSYSS